ISIEGPVARKTRSRHGAVFGKKRRTPVSAAAALYNLKALLLMKRDPEANQHAAKAELDIALKLAPDFGLAKRNHKGLEARAPAK
ncbi:MAG TPA: hypothetical protein VIM57_10920, partial [Luteolibacter sp.]